MVRIITFLLALTFAAWHSYAGDPVPLIKAHAHNDYYHKRPLLDALDNNFWSVEADIFLRDGELLVGHSVFELSKDRTLRKLYLEPLKKHFGKKTAKLGKNQQPFMLLVDIKTDGANVYKVLRKQLADYKEILAHHSDGKLHRGYVQVVISGDRPKETIAKDEPRLVGIDGRLTDLDSDLPSHLMPLISDRWTSHFRYRGDGEMPGSERKKLREIVEKAHAKGRRVRFWATPESETLWEELVGAGVDHINTDQLSRLRDFLSNKPSINE